MFRLQDNMANRVRMIPVSGDTNSIGTPTSTPVILACDTGVLQCAWPST